MSFDAVFFILRHLVDLEEAVPLRDSYFLEIANNWPVSAPFMCKPNNPEPTPLPLLYVFIRKICLCFLFF